MRHDPEDGILRVDIGTAAELRAQSIRDRILDLERDEARMRMLGVPERRFDHEGRVGGEVLLPRHARRSFIETLRPLRFELAQRIEHPHRDAGPETDAQGLIEVGEEAYAAAV